MTDIDLVREWVGSEPDDDTVQAKFNAAVAAGLTDPTRRVALSILRIRYADLAGGPTGFAVAGDYSESGTNPSRIAALIARLESELGEAVSTLPAMTSTPIVAEDSLTRCDPHVWR